MKSNLRNEIKSYIVRQGMTMQEAVSYTHLFEKLRKYLEENADEWDEW